MQMRSERRGSAMRVTSFARAIGAAMLLGVVAGCTQSLNTPLPVGAASYTVIPANAQAAAQNEYTIGPLDTLSVEVFEEPDLSAKDIQVDAAGNILLPLVGSVQAKDKTPAQLAREISLSLSTYLRTPRVTVSTNSITQKVAIEGEVNQPGVYEIKGNSSLLEALAMARSPTEVAKLDQIVVFRSISGQRAGAAFDLRRIRAGIDPDPVIVGGDRIVVGYSNVKGAWRDFLSSPITRLFRIF